MDDSLGVAPELQVTHWFNTDQPLSLTACRGKVVVLHAFQMLCPGCVSHGLPQANAIRAAFPGESVAVIGLHTVFEHHAVMGPDALGAFIHEYRWNFPIGVDTAAPTGNIPITMQAYGMRGTPTLILIDKTGKVRLHHFGRLDDLRVGGVLGRLLGESYSDSMVDVSTVSEQRNQGCGPDACATQN